MEGKTIVEILIKPVLLQSWDENIKATCHSYET